MTKSRPAFHICDFSTSLHDLKRSLQRDWPTVLRTIHENGRFSVFEATDNQVIATTLDALWNGGYIEYEEGSAYPWMKAKLTEKGKQLAGVK